MVEDTRAKAGAGPVFPVGLPRPVKVRADERGWPTSVMINREWLNVKVLDHWRIDDEWWRGEPVSRAYFSVLVGDSYKWVVFRDLVRDRWFRQGS